MQNKEWIDLLSKEFTVSRTSARDMLHAIMNIKRYDNFKRQFNPLPKEELKDVFLHGETHADMSKNSKYEMGVNMCYVVQVAIYHTSNNVFRDRKYFNNYTDAKAHFDKLCEYLRMKQERREIETWDMLILPYKGF